MIAINASTKARLHPPKQVGMQMRNQALARARLWGQLGVTLIELLVTLALMSIVSLAAVSMYTTASQSNRTIDNTQELQSKARMAFEIIGQAARIAGYEDLVGRKGSVASPNDSAFSGQVFDTTGSGSRTYALRGYDNSKIASGDVNTTTYDGANDNTGIFYSDSLALRYFGVGKPNDGSDADGSVVNCWGQAEAYPFDATVNSIPVSLFHVTTDANDGEPELSCVVLKRSGTGRLSQPLIRGVETFQVLYGVSPATTVLQSIDEAGVPSRWVSGRDMLASEWVRVRAIKVGLVIRGEIGSASAPSTAPLYPLGEAFVGSTTTDGGLKFIPPSDTRLRRAYSSTFLIRSPVARL